MIGLNNQNLPIRWELGLPFQDHVGERETTTQSLPDPKSGRMERVAIEILFFWTETTLF